MEYSDPDRVGVMILAECSADCPSSTDCTIENLRSATAYVIVVTAHNGVSDQDRGGALARQCDITLETSIARKSTAANNSLGPTRISYYTPKRYVAGL